MDEDLTNDQVAQLLKDAEQRMKSAPLRRSALEEAKIAVPSLSRFHTSTSTGQRDALPGPYVRLTSNGAEIDSQLFLNDNERNLSNAARHVTDPPEMKSKAAKTVDTGSRWVKFPKTTMTPEIKRDLQILRLRGIWDRKRHYKRNSALKNDVPEFFQVGTVIEGPTDFFTARLTKKARKRTLVDEVLAGEKSNQRFKSQYNRIQEAKKSGKKSHSQNLKAKRAHKDSKG